MRTLAFLLIVLVYHPLVAAQVRFSGDQAGTLHISIDDRPFADYVYQDAEISRPYFKEVHSANGVQVTRPQPPDPVKDIVDHPLFHPGIWLSFGDLSGSDFWRLAAKTRFLGFARPPEVTVGGGRFTVRFEYLDQKSPKYVLCEEQFDCRIVGLRYGTLLIWDSTFRSPQEFSFGDQEEMGLGVRMATGLRSEQQARGPIPPGTGTIVDSEGRKNGSEIWGNAARWCDYSGTLNGEQVGIALLCHPENFRPSRFHARDYGLLVANPFGHQAFKQGDKSTIIVEPGEELRLRYGIFVHTGNKSDIEAAYQSYLELATAN